MAPSSEKTDRHQLRLEKILSRATEAFARKGFHNASIRDISRLTGISLAGLYHYFSTKEELLFLIIETAFDSALANCKQSVNQYQGPDRIRFFIRNHMQIFVTNLSVAKVVVHEAGALRGEFRSRIQEKQRDYFQFLVTLLETQRGRPETDSKLAALCLLGMMNWIYTWYDPEKNRPLDEVTESMAEIFMRGFFRSGRLR